MTITAHQLPLTSLPLLLVTALPSFSLQLRVFSPTDHLRMDGFPGNPTVNPYFLNASGSAATRLDLSGVGWDVSNPARQLTLVSPRHFVGANHFRPGIGSSIRFLATDNTIHTLTVASITAIPNDDNSPSDVFVGEFTSEIPASAAITPLPYLNLATEAAYIGESLVIVGQAARGGIGAIGSVGDFGGDPITGSTGITTRAFTFSYGPAGSVNDCHAEGGDSGSPSFATRSGNAALVGTHTAVLTAAGTVTTYDTLVPHYVPELNAVMETTGLRMRKINPAETSLTATGTAVDATVRARKAFTYQVTVTNGPALAENVTASLTLPDGVTVSGISVPGWHPTSPTTIRRGSMAASQSAQFEISLVAASSGSLSLTLDLKSDGSSLQSYQLPLTILPSFAEWADGLQDATPAGDSDRDALSNLVEYAIGGDPQTGSRFFPGTGDLLSPELTEDPLGLSFIRRVDAPSRGIRYHLEAAEELAFPVWEDLGSLPTTIISAPGPGFEKVQSMLPETTAEKTFYRLRIELTE